MPKRKDRKLWESFDTIIGTSVTLENALCVKDFAKLKKFENDQKVFKADGSRTHPPVFFLFRFTRKVPKFKDEEKRIKDLTI